MKIVINDKHGGFSVSKEFLKHYKIPLTEHHNISRYDERLIEYIETYGSEAASGIFAKLIILDIPSGSYYRVREYDGLEWIEYLDETDWMIAE